MKLRIRGNSIRIRVDRKDLAELLNDGQIADEIRFGSARNKVLSYSVRIGCAPRGRPQVQYAAGRFLMTIDPADAEEWHRSENVGFGHEQANEDGAVVRVLLEKDFACIDGDSDESQEDAFPNPALAAGMRSC